MAPFSSSITVMLLLFDSYRSLMSDNYDDDEQGKVITSIFFIFTCIFAYPLFVILEIWEIWRTPRSQMLADLRTKLHRQLNENQFQVDKRRTTANDEHKEEEVEALGTGAAVIPATPTKTIYRRPSKVDGGILESSLFDADLLFDEEETTMKLTTKVWH